MTLTGTTDSDRAGPRNNAGEPGSHSKHGIETHFICNNAVKLNTYAYNYVPNYYHQVLNE